MKKMRLCLAVTAGLFCASVYAQDQSTVTDKKSVTTKKVSATDNTVKANGAGSEKPELKAEATGANGADAKASGCKPGCAMACCSKKKSGCAEGAAKKKCCKKKAEESKDKT